jgi:transposase InsO family protein
VFERLKKAGLVLNVAKCEFSKCSIDFLGHRIDSTGSRPLGDKVAAISKHPLPNTVRELQQFLGMINFYRKFMPAAAKLLCPLTDVLKGGPSGSTPLQWNQHMKEAFSAAKAALAAATALSHPIPSATLALVCDASSTHVGAALQQQRPFSNTWEPLGFFSKKLDKPQLSYSAFDRELYAAFAAIRHFRYQLEGRQFQLWTDHKPLIFAAKKVDEGWTPRAQRQLAYLSEYTADIRHVAGVDNVVADTLSRPPASPPPAVTLPINRTPHSGGLLNSGVGIDERVCPGSLASSTSSSTAPTVAGCLPVQSSPGCFIDLAAIAADQQGCAETAAAADSSSLAVVPLGVGDSLLLCATSSNLIRPLVPVNHRRRVFASVHGMAHPGIRATRRLISSRWVWRGMAKDIGDWCRDCQDCQRGKVTRQHKAPLEPIAIPERRFSHIHVDLVGPLPSSEGVTNLLTVIDRSTRWLEAIPLQSTTATAVADALVAGWIARFGVPADLTSDRGVQFSSDVWAVLMSRLGIRHHLTTAYHPQANGMIERAHRQLKDALRARLAGSDWLSHLPYVLLSLRATPKEDANISSAELVYGAPILLPGQLQHGPDSPPAVFAAKERSGPLTIPTRPQPPSGNLQEGQLPQDLQQASHIYIRRGGVAKPLSTEYSGPYRVVQRSPKFFTVDLGDRQDTISVDRIKPHLGTAPVTPAVAPRRGRPPRSATTPPDSSLGAG